MTNGRAGTTFTHDSRHPGLVAALPPVDVVSKTSLEDVRAIA